MAQESALQFHVVHTAATDITYAWALHNNVFTTQSFEGKILQKKSNSVWYYNKYLK